MTKTSAPASAAPSLSLRGVFKLGAMLLASVVLMPLQWLLMRFTHGPGAFVVPRWWFACLRRALGIQVEVVGTPRLGGGTLFVGNHVSHYDIVALGSLLRARFIAKNDMERWPGMRFVGALAQTVYISRRQRDAAAVAAAVAAQLRPDHDLVLFPEGTTSSGEQVAPFKSSLFALFLQRSVGSPAWVVQPFTQEILSVDGKPLSAGGDRAAYAFHGAMQAGAHVLHFLGLSGARVRITFHPPIAIEEGIDRKRLALRLHDIVAGALPSHLSGTSDRDGSIAPHG
jgi:1-acyl-sn-glycerol-3-phosphate acyltransferase